MTFVMSSLNPHLIMAIDASVAFLLGYSRHELLGQHMHIFYGPDTDTALIQSTLSQAQAVQPTTKISVVLYDKQMRRRRIFLSFMYNQNDSKNSDCTTMIEHIPDIMAPITAVSVARLPSTAAWVSLSLEWPHPVLKVSAGFTQLLGYEELDLLSQNLPHIIKPRRAMSAPWRALLRASSSGFATRDIVEACTRFGREMLVDVTCAPVVNPEQGRFQSILVLFVDDAVAAPDPVQHASAVPHLFGGEPPSDIRQCLLQEVIRSEAAAAAVGAGSGTGGRGVFVDEAYVRRVRRRHMAAAARSAASPSSSPPS